MNDTHCALIALLAVSLIGCSDTDSSTSHSAANNANMSSNTSDDVAASFCQPRPESEIEDCIITAGDVSVREDNPDIGVHRITTQAQLDEVCQSTCSRFEYPLKLEGLPGVTDLTALRNTRSIQGGLSIRYTDDLELLKGLENLTMDHKQRELGGLSISNNKSLKTLEGLNLPAVLDGSGFKEFSGYTPSVSIMNNASLTSLKGLEQIEETRFVGVDVQANKSLKSVDGLQNLTHNKDTAGIRIRNNPALESLRLDSLETAMSLNIDSNGVLRTLEVPNLEELDSFIVHENELLPYCQLEQIAARIDIHER